MIKALTQGSPEEQERAISTYFLPEAAFVHPFCRVPSFAEYELPLVGYTITSQWLILMIYRWYRILSPNIDIEIYSAGEFTFYLPAYSPLPPVTRPGGAGHVLERDF